LTCGFAGGTVNAVILRLRETATLG